MTAKKNTARKPSTELEINPTQTHIVETLPAILREVNDGAAKSLEVRLGGLENVLNADYICKDQKAVVAATEEFSKDLFTGTALAYNLWAKKSASLGPILLKLWESYDANVKEFNKTAAKDKRIQPGQNWWIQRFFFPEFPAERQQNGVNPVTGAMGYMLWSTVIQTPLGETEVKPWNVIQELLRVGRNVREEKVRRNTFLEVKRKELAEKNVDERLPELELSIEQNDKELKALAVKVERATDEEEKQALIESMNEIEATKSAVLKEKREIDSIVNTINALEAGLVPPKDTAVRAARRTEDEMVKALSPRLLALSIQCQEDISGMMESQSIDYHTAEDGIHGGAVQKWSLRGILTQFFLDNNDEKVLSSTGKADLNAAVDFVYHTLDNLCKVAIGRAVKETCIELGTEKRPVFGLHEAVKKEGSDEAFYGKGQKYNDLMLNAKIIAHVEEPKADTAPTAPATGKTA